MAYLRCESCGSKALVAASRCPRCAHEFRLLDGRGERAALVKCRGCGIMHAKGTACHWCPTGTGSGLLAIGGPAVRAAAVLLAIGLSGAAAWTYRAPLQAAVSATVASAQATLARSRSATTGAGAVIASTAGVPALRTPAPPVVRAQIAVVTPPPDVAQAALPDTVQWVPAVARTWVNVRMNEGRDADVVGIIKPASRAMLGGTGRAGWRQVRSDSVTGWVNPKHFDADSSRTRG